MLLHIAGLAFAGCLVPGMAMAGGEPGWIAPDKWFVYLIVLFLLFGALLGLLLIRGSLIASAWSFSDALSEETEVTGYEQDANGVRKILRDAATGKPIAVTEMRASSSRVIAFMGSLIMMFVFLGFGAVALYSFAQTGTIPANLDKVVDFLLAGLTLFAPYTVNKFSKIFEGFAPKRG